ncbi:cinnamoyl-CoA--phenyllactate CoA-transferase [Lactobacillus plantarum] [Lactiplantibacillus mudanjiangensis]|uniref:CaiB/BaiF CoA transferase family protein n=1 Tax=Lactiplantibacillus mudanjiangensis TaxID=1296538 RepID=UPI0010157509|nr:cinnamoyl-CoA--phenyllactate CoA-transferase [Lactobacillus plantarum] [Lactiplantibacillus mudanjiangensis]
MSKTLDGVRIVDMTTFLAAPTVTRVLGEWGADVIKVEPPKGDAERTQGAVFNMHYSDDENLGFDISNLNKRFVTLNLRKDDGRQAFYDLLKDANVFVTNVRTKSLEHLGIDYETLKQKFPKLIFAQVLGYGEHGPQKDAAGFDATAYMARGGVLGTTLEAGQSPMNPANGYGDFQVSMCLAAGICGALLKQAREGKGDKLTVSLHHAAIFMQNVAMVSAQYGNEYPKSRLNVANPFNDCFKTSDDRWFVMCVPVFNRDYNKVMTLIGREDLVDDPRYNNIDHINAEQLNQEFINILDTQFKQQPLQHWVDIFKENDLPLEACYVPTEIYKDAEALDNDEIRQIKFPSGNERMIPTNPVRFESMGNPELKVSRPQGADTRNVLSELGYSDEKINQLLADGAAATTRHIGDPVK